MSFIEQARRRAIFALAVVLVLGSPTGARNAERAETDERVRIERLTALAKVWGHAKYFHPTLANRPDIDWDAALVTTIPEVRSARTRQEYAAAVGKMLDRLGDPLTRVIDGSSAPIASAAGREFGFRWEAGEVLVITAGDYYALGAPAVHVKLKEIADALPKAKAVVFDLRSGRAVDAFGRLQLAGAFDGVQRLLSASPVPAPGDRRRVYYGFENAGPFSSGQYRTGYFVRNGAQILPSRDATDVPSVFLLNEHASVLPVTIPLQVAGKALVVYEGDIERHSVGRTTAVPLGEDLVAQLRDSELIFPDGTSGELAPDTVVAVESPGGIDAGLERALAAARAFEPSRVARATLPASVALARERSYPEMRYPAVEYRLLAAFRIWSAIEYFYPYKHLLDRDWSTVLRDVIPIFEAARDAREYSLAVAEMATRIQDSHAYVSGPVFNEDVIGNGYPPIRVRVVEGLPVVTSLGGSEAARSAGVEVGDVVVRVDGEAAPDRLARTARYISVSTPQSGTDKAALVFMNGPVGSSVTLTLRDGRGREKQVVLERRREDYTTLYHRERDGEIVQILAGNVGYVDLDRLTYAMVEPMFERLKETKAIIFDMRGYPNGTVWAIAPRLADAPRTVALFETPMPGHGSPAPSSEAFAMRLEPAAERMRYRGRTVMLIDERTMSQAEHTGLYLKAANRTTFVGGRTAGANGEITSIGVPGGIAVGFTGQGVRFPDGRQLQRVGLVPDVEVRPTLAGIRAGRDEVLEAALRILSSESQ